MLPDCENSDTVPTYHQRLDDTRFQPYIEGKLLKSCFSFSQRDVVTSSTLLDFSCRNTWSVTDWRERPRVCNFRPTDWYFHDQRNSCRFSIDTYNYHHCIKKRSWEPALTENAEHPNTFTTYNDTRYLSDHSWRDDLSGGCFYNRHQSSLSRGSTDGMECRYNTPFAINHSNISNERIQTNDGSHTRSILQFPFYDSQDTSLENHINFSERVFAPLGYSKQHQAEPELSPCPFVDITPTPSCVVTLAPTVETSLSAMEQKETTSESKTSIVNSGRIEVSSTSQRRRYRPYRCSSLDCGRSFARNEELTRHVRIHTGYRPYQCPVCRKTFTRKDHLNKHKRTHLQSCEKRVFACPVPGCDQRYTRSDAVARHQMAAHGSVVKQVMNN